MGRKRKVDVALTPLAVSIFYGLFASVWIATSDWLVQQLPGAHPVSNTIKGLLFVGITTLLLFLLLTTLCRQRDANQEAALSLEDERWQTPRGLGLLLGILGGALLVALVATGVSRLQAPQLIQEAKSQLATEAELKAVRIEQWLRERTGDALVLQNQYDGSESIHQLLTAPSSSRPRAS